MKNFKVSLASNQNSTWKLITRKVIQIERFYENRMYRKIKYI